MPEYFILFYLFILFISEKLGLAFFQIEYFKISKVHNILIVHIVKSPLIIASQIGIKNHLVLHILAYHKCEFVCRMYYP